jgi:putative phosphoribosyl transferase
VRARGARAAVVAVPVAPEVACEAMRGVADEVVCLYTPRPFLSVGGWYEDFRQVDGEQVRQLLEP